MLAKMVKFICVSRLRMFHQQEKTAPHVFNSSLMNIYSGVLLSIKESINNFYQIIRNHKHLTIGRKCNVPKVSADLICSNIYSFMKSNM
jgi:hypothetical protein